MAEILIRAVDNHNPHNEADDRRCYKRGMPVVVVEDGHEWGAKEGPPNFTVIKIPGVSKAQVQKYIELELDEQGKHHRRRQWQIALDEMPAKARAALADRGLEVGPDRDYSWGQIKQFFRNLKTGLSETEEL